MTEATRSVLVVGVGDDTYEEILEALGSRYFFAERVDTTAEALQLAASLPYDAVILTCPLSDAELSDTIRSLRKPTSESHTAAIALLALTGELDSARELVGKGANCVVSEDEIAKVLSHELRRLTEAQPRIDLRTMTRLKLQLHWGAGNYLCQTVNVSVTGMLVRTDHQVELGTKVEFELSLPGESAPVRGSAVAVRHAAPVRERISGLGLRFASFEGGDQNRLRQWLGRHGH